MHRIPKSAQRHIDRLNKVRADTAVALAAAAMARAARTPLVDCPVPRYMSLDSTPRDVAAAHDVYLNGVKQRLCIVADMDKGFIKRYVAGVGNIPALNRHGKADTELLFGDVRIVRRGEKLAAE